MLIVMNQNATKEQVQSVVNILNEKQLKPEILPGATRVAIGVMGNKYEVAEGIISRMEGVKEIIHVTKPYKRVSREFKPEKTKIDIGSGVIFGEEKLRMIAGPCSVESEKQIIETAHAVKEMGASALRGGIFKPRTSPYFFQGLGYPGLQFLLRAKEETKLPLVVEIISAEDIPLFNEMVDVVQVGSRNMHNFDLLKRLGKIQKPILLKRGFSATLDEFLLSAEYILDGGNPNVILCERGIRTFENSTRNTLDLNSVALIKHLSHLPIIVDPSHAAGRYDLVADLARAAVAIGVDGLLVEVHPRPQEALSDSNQQLNFEQFKKLMNEIEIIYDACTQKIFA